MTTAENEIRQRLLALELLRRRMAEVSDLAQRASVAAFDAADVDKSDTFEQMEHSRRLVKLIQQTLASFGVVRAMVRIATENDEAIFGRAAEKESRAALFAMSDKIPAGGTVTVRQIIRKRCCPRRIDMLGRNAGVLKVRDARGGVELLLEQTEDDPFAAGLASGELIQGRYVLRPLTLEVGMEFSLMVENVGERTEQFCAEVLGNLVPYFEGA